MHFEVAAVAFIKALDFNPQQKDSPLVRHSGFVGRRTLEDYRTSFKALGKHFKGKILKDITPLDIREYQEKRSAGEYTDFSKRSKTINGSGVCSNTINKEVGTLLRLLRASKAWTAEMMESYIALTPHEAEVQRAMTPSEQEHFLRVAASKERWAAIYWYSILALKTTMSTNELRETRLRDLDVSQGVIKVSAAGAKNKYRMRSVPLDSEAIKAAEFLLARAKSMGSHLPEHALFPTKISSHGSVCDPMQVSECWHRKCFEEVRAAAGIPWLRPYDLRHTAITRLAEAGTPIQVIMDMAGHVSQKMQQHYTHISMQAKRQAVNISALTQAAALKKRPQGTVREAAFAAAEKVDNALAAGAVSIGNLIKRLQRAGLGADMILGILADGGDQI